MNFSIDVVMNKYYRVMKAFVSLPPLAWSENDKTTTVGSRTAVVD